MKFVAVFLTVVQISQAMSVVKRNGERREHIHSFYPYILRSHSPTLINSSSRPLTMAMAELKLILNTIGHFMIGILKETGKLQ